MIKKFICINCPLGCSLTVSINNDEINVSGYSCKRGESYGRQEAIHPERILTGLMKVDGIQHPISIKSSDPIPKDMLLKCSKALHSILSECLYIAEIF